MGEVDGLEQLGIGDDNNDDGDDDDSEDDFVVVDDESAVADIVLQFFSEDVSLVCTEFSAFKVACSFKH